MLSINRYLAIWYFILLYFLKGQIDVPRSIDSSLYFDIVHKDKVVGSLKASQKIEGSKVYYQSFTSIKIQIIKDIQVNYKYDVTFENKILKKTDVKITLNDKPHAETQTQWKDAQYKIAKNDKNEVVLKDNIDYSTILLYFEEPINIDRCYSEQDGSFNTIIPLGSHSYKKINSKGKENLYYYKKGVLKNTIIDGGLIHFQMIARE